MKDVVRRLTCVLAIVAMTGMAATADGDSRTDRKPFSTARFTREISAGNKGSAHSRWQQRFGNVETEMARSLTLYLTRTLFIKQVRTRLADNNADRLLSFARRLDGLELEYAVQVIDGRLTEESCVVSFGVFPRWQVRNCRWYGGVVSQDHIATLAVLMAKNGLTIEHTSLVCATRQDLREAKELLRVLQADENVLSYIPGPGEATCSEEQSCRIEFEFRFLETMRSKSVNSRRKNRGEVAYDRLAQKR